MTNLLGLIFNTALVLYLSVRAMKRGFWPSETNSRAWYDRFINAFGGIVLLAFWAFLVFAYYFGPPLKVRP